jgi:hypothetical protein
MVKQSPRILVACARRGYPRPFAILPGYDLSFVGTLAESHAALQNGRFHLVMIGLYFDESRMFELLQYLKDDKRYSDVPVICFRGVEASGDPGNVGLSGVEAACTEMGAKAFVDLLAMPDDALGNSAIRTLIHEILESHRTGA